jgi:hypothetical protein
VLVGDGAVVIDVADPLGVIEQIAETVRTIPLLRTVLFARGENVSQIKGRSCNRKAKSARWRFLSFRSQTGSGDSRRRAELNSRVYRSIAGSGPEPRGEVIQQPDL